MAIIRTQYITVEELNEILGVSTYTIDDTIKIYEASEMLEYYMFDRINTYDTSTAPKNLKLATAYQVSFNEENEDNTYQADGFTIGKFSSNTGAISGREEYFKISPKSRRYLFDGKLTRRNV